MGPAEQVSSLGKDWHQPWGTMCEKCGKTLMSGSLAEHEGKPYYNHPSYDAMFGLKGIGCGGAESHTFEKTQVMEMSSLAAHWVTALPG